jgi:hypothetical protein
MTNVTTHLAEPLADPAEKQWTGINVSRFRRLEVRRISAQLRIFFTIDIHLR